MTTLSLQDDVLQVRFTATEKVLGLVRDLDIPIAEVSAAQVLPRGLDGARGWRVGLAVPWVRALGTWHAWLHPAHRTLVSVRAGQPAVRLDLTGSRYDAAVLGDDRAWALVERLRKRLTPPGSIR